MTAYKLGIDPAPSELFREILGIGVAAREVRGELRGVECSPDEFKIVEFACASRKNEFAAGRACARAALEVLGYTNVVILRGEGREPKWPADITGSITHTAGYCAAVVAPRKLFLSLGIDIEKKGGVPRDIWHLVCSSSELGRISNLPDGSKAQAVSTIFSAKESYFKCQYPITKTWLDFEDVEIYFEDDLASAPTSGILYFNRSGRIATGKFKFVDEFVATAVGLRSTDF